MLVVPCPVPDRTPGQPPHAVAASVAAERDLNVGALALRATRVPATERVGAEHWTIDCGRSERPDCSTSDTPEGAGTAARGTRVSVALPVIGAVVVLAVLQDVFTTVLFPSGGRGVLRKPLSRAIWRGFRALARRLSPRRRRHLLTLSGPVIISVNLLAWPALLILGFSLVYLPALGDGIRASPGPTDTSWATAVYYSGFTLTTLGVGDVAATTAPYRLLTVVQAGLGFGGITMAITYFLSVYRSLIVRDSGARALHQRTGGTGDAAQLVLGFAQDGDVTAARQQLSSTAELLRHLHESQSFYPVLHYFRREEPLYALPRVLLVTLDSLALLHSALDRDRYGPLLRSRALDEVEQASDDLLNRLLPGESSVDDAAIDADGWRRRFDGAVSVLRAEGIEVAPDPAPTSTVSAGGNRGCGRPRTSSGTAGRRSPSRSKTSDAPLTASARFLRDEQPQGEVGDLTGADEAEHDEEQPHQRHADPEPAPDRTADAGDHPSAPPAWSLQRPRACHRSSFAPSVPCPMPEDARCDAASEAGGQRGPRDWPLG